MPRDRAAVAEAPPGTEGQRECARAEWCLDYRLENVDGNAVRCPALVWRPFCDKDRSDITRCLKVMPEQYIRLRAELGVPGHSGQQIRIPFGPRIPLRVDVDALMRLFTESLYSWHERVAEVYRLDFPSADSSRFRRDAQHVKRAVDVLAPRVDSLLALQPAPVRRAYDLRALADLPDDTPGIVHSAFAEINLDLAGADAGLEILHLSYLAKAVLGETRAKPVPLEGVPCRADGCGLRALVRAEPPADASDPGNWSECLVCGDTMTEAEYGDWTALCAAYERNRLREPGTLRNLPGVA